MAESPKYGGRGRPWHPEFIKYMEFIAKHPKYKGMPDLYYEPGRIQWEAPSNRATGAFKDTHARRRAWWEKKAKEEGISTATDRWISRVAKTIHPTKEKPCKICGRILELRYVYPQERLLDKVRALPFVTKDFPLDRLERITELVKRLHQSYGAKALAALPRLLGTTAVPTPTPPPSSLRGWLDWIESSYIPSEPRLLSPGAMSNAPDRLDGFHSDNLCCRGTADKGRNKQNLATYVTDRRAFEYWASGNWVAADRLMGQVRNLFRTEPCLHGHAGPCAADHIGPISLGFTHRPKFQALCGPCNGAKNNRMYLSDVRILLADEKRGDGVISWHSRELWNRCKHRVTTDETARRLSKLLRDNRHTLMHALQRIAEDRNYLFLTTLLELEHADFDFDFKNLRVERHVTVFDAMKETARTTKYAQEQKARRCRIAFSELLRYFKKQNRNAYIIDCPECADLLADVLRELSKLRHVTARLDEAIEAACRLKDADEMDAAFRDLVPKLAASPSYDQARAALTRYMDAVGKELAGRWEDERYVRATDEDDGDQPAD